MDFDGGVEGLQFSGVSGEVLVGEVADVDCAGAVVGELVGGGAADAEGGVCAGYDHYFVFDSPVIHMSLDCVDMVGEKGVLASRIPGYSSDLGYVFEGAWVCRLDRKLLAEGGETLLGR